MNFQIYFPNDLIKKLNKKRNKFKKFYLLGYKFNNIIIVVQIVENDFHKYLTKLPQSLKYLRIVGSVNRNEYDLNFRQDQAYKYPIISNGPDSYSVILFDPPNFKNLEYFSIHPILLQSTGNEKPIANDLVKKLDCFEPISETKHVSSIADDQVLDKINQVLKIRIWYRKWLEELELIKPTYSLNNQILKHFYRVLFKLLVYFILIIQYLSIWIIWSLNYKILNISLSDCSQVLRQTDLRLKQINYFPIQFLCYYDKNILYKDSILLKKLKLPIFNSNLNINNSNYINLHNSIWLIFNDVLLGVTCYKLIIENFDTIVALINNYFIKKILFNDLYELISWVSFNHPAGFKLNNELGQFMGDLFLWTLNFWKYLINDLIEVNFSDNLKVKLIIGFKSFLKILCYCGFTFLLGWIIDLLNIITFHIYCFYYTSAKIYKRQIEIIKSLFQLFRGKKYNVLRNRIDNLDNYSHPGEFFEVDQLLLGTLLFMILVLLLPTVFAFYLMFFSLRLIILMSLNFLENLLILINFLPLFVLLLKFKNSNRLQGGISFNYLTTIDSTNYLKLSNKSLSYNEIFEDFIKLFKNSKNFKESLVQLFLRGELISIKHNYNLKFNYLMLPENYDKSIEIWKYFE